MQRQVGRLEAEAVAADVDDSALHALERVGDLHHGAAVALDELDLVRGARGDALGHLRHEERVHEIDVGVHHRMAGGDAQLDVLRPCRGGRGCGQRDGGCSGFQPMLHCALLISSREIARIAQISQWQSQLARGEFFPDGKARKM